MQQFIRYLYECENEKRVRNIGFVKVDKQGEQYVVHIHGKGVDFGTDKRVEVLVLCEMEGQLIGSSQGYAESDIPMIHSILRFDSSDVGGEEAFARVSGILLVNQTGKNYFASWDDRQPNLTDMVRREEWEKQQEEKQRQEEQEAIQAEEVEIEAVEPEAEESEVETYIPPKSRTYEKIQRQDLARLPRKDWRLANNNFLLHGFYNYHHLLYITEGEHIWIGVPGIYHEKEEAAAKAFGFPQFHRLTDAEVELSFEETNTAEDFGYWCRVIT